MALGTDYQVYLLDSFGIAYRKNITAHVRRLSCQRVVNDVGAIELELVDMEANLFLTDSRILVYRTFPGYPATILFNTVYLVRRRGQALDEQGIYTASIGGVDANHLLKRRIVAYKAGTSQAKKTAAIDNMMKAIVRENLGSLATDTTRSLASYLSIAADLGAAPSITSGFSHQNVLEVLIKLAQTSAQKGTYLAFDITAAGETQLLFSTYTGQRGLDRRKGQGNQFLLSLERGNVGSSDYTVDWSEEITRVYAGAKGEKSERNVQSAQDTTRINRGPFNLIEDFHDAFQIEQSDTTGATEEARGVLRAGRPRLTISAQIKETPGSIFGVSFDFGDYVTADVFGEQVDCRLDYMGLTLERDDSDQPFKETLDCLVRLE